MIRIRQNKRNDILAVALFVAGGWFEAFFPGAAEAVLAMGTDAMPAPASLIRNVEHSPKQDTVALLGWSNRHFLLQTGTIRLFYNKDSTGGFLWILFSDTASTGIATRIVHGKQFDLLDTAKVQTITPFSDGHRLGVEILGQTAGMEFRCRIAVFRGAPGLIRFWAAATPFQDLAITDNPKDFYFYDLQTAKNVSLALLVHAEQLPFAAGVTYFSEKSALASTIFYFQNYTSLTDYFEAIGAEPRQAVFARSRDFGYTRPFTRNGRLPAGRAVVLTDAFLRIMPGIPASEEEKALWFTESLAHILEQLIQNNELPDLPPIDWPGIAARTLQDLQDPACWVHVNGKEYLRSYVDLNRPGTAELITQLEVLVGLRRYIQGAIAPPAADTLYRKLAANLVNFYHSGYRTVVNDVPIQGVTRGDSWYAIQLHLGLSALASMGDSTARTLLFASVPALMELAHNVDYRFPVFFDYATNLPIEGTEPDAAGGYAYLMLDLYEMTRDTLYLREAERAVARIRGKGFHLAYEIHMTAAAAAACARLFRITGKEHFLRWSFMPVANILHLSWIWECDYGYANRYRTFFGLSPMPMTGYVASKELHETWFYLLEYLEIAADRLPPAVVAAVQVFLDYAPAVLYSALPPFMPPGALFAGRCVYDSYNRADLAIPVEDLRTGFEQSGRVGQQIYGTGAPFLFSSYGVGVRQTEQQSRMPEKLALQIYPNPLRWKRGTGAVKFRLEWGQMAFRKGELRVFNAMGQVVWQRKLILGREGRREVAWSLPDGPLPAGVYFVQFRVGPLVRVNKFILLK